MIQKNMSGELQPLDGGAGYFDFLVGRHHDHAAVFQVPTPIIPPGCPTVLIGGMPAARVGDMSGCGAPSLPPGCPTVMIGG